MRKATENVLQVLTTIETIQKPEIKVVPTAEDDVDLNFTYDQYDLLYRAGLITHEQIRKGTVKRNEYRKIERFLNEDRDAIERLQAEAGSHDVIITSEFPTVLDCGLKRVDSKRYSKDFVVNRATPQMQRRVWKVKSVSAEGTEIIKGAVAGEKESIPDDTKQVGEEWVWM